MLLHPAPTELQRSSVRRSSRQILLLAVPPFPISPRHGGHSYGVVTECLARAVSSSNYLRLQDVRGFHRPSTRMFRLSVAVPRSVSGASEIRCNPQHGAFGIAQRARATAQPMANQQATGRGRSIQPHSSWPSIGPSPAQPLYRSLARRRICVLGPRERRPEPTTLTEIAPTILQCPVAALLGARASLQTGGPVLRPQQPRNTLWN